MRSPKLNTKQILDILIASIAVEQLPDIVSKFTGFYSDTLTPVIAGGGAYALGMALKKPLVANAGIALAASGFVNDMLSGVTSGLLGGGASAPQVTQGATPDKRMLKEFVSLNDYTDRITTQNNYADFYENN